MGIKGIELLGVLGLGLVVVVVLVGEAEAQSISCTTAVTSLAPCLNFITGNSSTPSSQCCSKLSDVVQSSPQCLCSVVNGGAVGSLGISINKTKALSLPGACNVRTPPISQCQAAKGPTASAAPTASPSPPADTSDKSPQAAVTPSASDIPVGGGGAKSVPTTDGSSSDGSSSDGSTALKAAPMHVMLFLVFVASWASSTLSV